MQQFSSNDVVALTGITPRQLQWWDERGIVVPQRSGRKRIYTFDDLTAVALICSLRHHGFSLQRVRHVLTALEREFGKRLSDVASGNAWHLLTDGKNLYLETDTRQIIDILKNARQPMLTVCITDAVRQLRADIRQAKVESASQRTHGRGVRPETPRTTEEVRKRVRKSAGSGETAPQPQRFQRRKRWSEN